jgi:hypothetical protein
VVGCIHAGATSRPEVDRSQRSRLDVSTLPTARLIIAAVGKLDMRRPDPAVHFLEVEGHVWARTAKPTKVLVLPDQRREARFAGHSADRRAGKRLDVTDP